MKKVKVTAEDRVAQMIGSMALSGMRVTGEQRKLMLQIIRDHADAKELRKQLMEKYCARGTQKG